MNQEEDIIDYRVTNDKEGHWVEILVNGFPYCEIGPFMDHETAKLMLEEIMEHMREIGAKDLKHLQ